MKTIKFRIEPNSQQRDVIDQMIDANRIIYNNMLTYSHHFFFSSGIFSILTGGTP